MEPPIPETSSTDFDDLCVKAYAEGSSMEDKHALWRAVFGMKEWNFIARGIFPEMTPYVAANKAVGGGQYMLKAFTDPKRLHVFATANGLTDEKGVIHLITMPVAGFMDTVEKYRGLGVFGVHFNGDSGSAGFYAPFPQLVAIRDLLAKLDGEGPKA